MSGSAPASGPDARALRAPDAGTSRRVRMRGAPAHSNAARPQVQTGAARALTCSPLTACAPWRCSGVHRAATARATRAATAAGARAAATRAAVSGAARATRVPALPQVHAPLPSGGVCRLPSFWTWGRMAGGGSIRSPRQRRLVCPLGEKASHASRNGRPPRRQAHPAGEEQGHDVDARAASALHLTEFSSPGRFEVTKKWR